MSTTSASSSKRHARRRRDMVVHCEEAPAHAEAQAPRLSTLVVKAASVYGGADKRPMVMGGTAVERSMLSMGSIAIYNVKPTVAKSSVVARERKRYTLYAVHVQNAITGRSWVVHRRYSDFLLLRQMIVEHFQQFQAVFPKLEELVAGLYFPRKHKVRSNTGRVVQHRCEAFLEYLATLHRLLISQCYLQQRHISDLGLSIMRGFLGSTNVRHAMHSAAYAFPNPTMQCKLVAGDRAPVNQCGTLKTVLEDELEYEDCDDADFVGEMEPVADSADEESVFSDTDSYSTSSDYEDADDAGRAARHATKKRSKRNLFGLLGKSAKP